MTSGRVLGYERPVSLGGALHPDPDVVTIRWFGTACFEVVIGDRVLLLDQHYARSVRNRSLGFDVTEVTRADVLLVGHPHPDHVSDTAQEALQHGRPRGDRPPRRGRPLPRAPAWPAVGSYRSPASAKGTGSPFANLSVVALHGFHGDADLDEDLAKAVAELQAAEAALDALLLPPVSAEELAAGEAIFGRGLLIPEVITEETLTYVIDVDGFKIVYRDSGGKLSDEGSPTTSAPTPVAMSPWCRSTVGRTGSRTSMTCFYPSWSSISPRCSSGLPRRTVRRALGPGSLQRLFVDVATELLKEHVHAVLRDGHGVARTRRADPHPPDYQAGCALGEGAEVLVTA